MITEQNSDTIEIQIGEFWVDKQYSLADSIGLEDPICHQHQANTTHPPLSL